MTRNKQKQKQTKRKKQTKTMEMEQPKTTEPMEKEEESKSKVKLITYSQTANKTNETKETNGSTSDETNKTNNSLGHWIAYCARVSNPANQQLTTETNDQRLIRYLIKNKHWSPFEMATICLEISSSRDIIRQVLRHRSFSFQEFSQRYANTSELGFVKRDCRMQDNKNRQNSLVCTDDELAMLWDMRQQEVIDCAQAAYNWAIDYGIAKEVARSVLPEGCQRSTAYINGSVRSWIHYIEVRTHPSTQLEHRELAIQCAAVIAPIFPMIMEFVHA